MSRMTDQERDEWIGFCKAATPSQLRAIIEKERYTCDHAPDDVYRQDCYTLALEVRGETI